MYKELDKLFAEKLGFYNVEETDLGTVVGREPRWGKLKIVPSPSSNNKDFDRLFHYLIRNRNFISIKYTGVYQVTIDGKTFISSDFKDCITEAFLEIYTN